jgi:hypothetical protein
MSCSGFARPTIEKLLSEYGVPLDLSALGREPEELPARKVLSLPAELARREAGERALNGMFGAPVHFGKLVDRIELDARIPLTSWREPLTDRFSRAALLLEKAPREELPKWGDGRPYATMAAARYTAQSARRTSSDIATEFDVQMGIDEAERHLRDDGA